MPTKTVEVPEGFLKADLHCHTFHSGKTGHMTAFEPMDSYSTPQQLYDLAKRRGMQQLSLGKTMIGGKYGHFHHMFNDAMGVYLNYFRDLVFRRNVHVHWPFWKELRNAFGWIVCLPVFFSGALGGLTVRYWIEKFRQKDYERLIAELSPFVVANSFATENSD